VTRVLTPLRTDSRTHALEIYAQYIWYFSRGNSISIANHWQIVYSRISNKFRFRARERWEMSLQLDWAENGTAHANQFSISVFNSVFFASIGQFCTFCFSIFLRRRSLLACENSRGVTVGPQWFLKILQNLILFSICQ